MLIAGSCRAGIGCCRSFSRIFGGAPAWVLALEADDRGFDRRWQAIGLPIRSPAPIGERLCAARLVAVKDPVPRLTGDPELRAQRRHFLAVQEARDKAQSPVITVRDGYLRLWRDAVDTQRVQLVVLGHGLDVVGGHRHVYQLS